MAPSPPGWPRIAAAGPRAPLPDVDEIAAPPEGNGVADSQVLAHGPRPLVCVIVCYLPAFFRKATISAENSGAGRAENESTALQRAGSATRHRAAVLPATKMKTSSPPTWIARARTRRATSRMAGVSATKVYSNTSSPSPRSTIETTAWQETKDVSAAEEAMRETVVVQFQRRTASHFDFAFCYQHVRRALRARGARTPSS